MSGLRDAFYARPRSASPGSEAEAEMAAAAAEADYALAAAVGRGRAEAEAEAEAGGRRPLFDAGPIEDEPDYDELAAMEEAERMARDGDGAHGELWYAGERAGAPNDAEATAEIELDRQAARDVALSHIRTRTTPPAPRPTAPLFDAAPDDDGPDFDEIAAMEEAEQAAVGDRGAGRMDTPPLDDGPNFDELAAMEQDEQAATGGRDAISGQMPLGENGA